MNSEHELLYKYMLRHLHTHMHAARWHSIAGQCNHQSISAAALLGPNVITCRPTAAAAAYIITIYLLMTHSSEDWSGTAVMRVLLSSNDFFIIEIFTFLVREGSHHLASVYLQQGYTYRCRHTPRITHLIGLCRGEAVDCATFVCVYVHNLKVQTNRIISLSNSFPI